MSRSSGFSLVELLVALVVGLIVVLGAGQLFLTVFQTNTKVMVLSEKQAAVNFAVETLLRDIRRADPDSIEWAGSALKLTVPNRGDLAEASCSDGDDVSKAFRVSESGGNGWAFEVANECSSVPIDIDDAGTVFSEIVVAFDDGGFSIDTSLAAEGVWVVTFKLIPTAGSAPDILKFYAVNRTAAVTEL